MSKVTIRAFMTAAPHVIDVNQPVAVAAAFMREHHIRHLPVLAGAELVGLLSERDILLVERLRAVDPATLFVREAMTAAPHTISPESSLEWVTAEMAQQKIGSMIVVERGRVVGIFTTIDALRALGEVLWRARRRSATRQTASR